MLGVCMSFPIAVTPTPGLTRRRERLPTTMKFSAVLASALLVCAACCLPGTPQAAGRSDVAVVAAAQQGQAEAVEQLLAGGVDPDARYADGYTALMWAAEKGRYTTVQVLLKHGAAKDLRNDAGLTALDLATRRQHGDLVALLRDAS